MQQSPTDTDASAATGVSPLPLSADVAQTLVQQAQVGLLVAQDGLIRYVNPALCELLGCGPEALLGLHAASISAPEHQQAAHEVIRRRLAGKIGRPGQVRTMRSDGSSFQARVVARRIQYEDRPAVLFTMTDTTELESALRSAEWSAKMLARSEALCGLGSFEVTWPAGVVTMSAGLRMLLGLPMQDEQPQTLDALSWVPDEERALVAGLWKAAEPGEPFDFQHRIQRLDGRKLTVHHRAVVETDIDGVRRGVAILQDVTAQREAEERIEELSSHDEVTGLHNRSWLLDRVDAAMHSARWEARGVALFSVDVARITDIKASMGFGAGDTLAMALAARLSVAARQGELVARVGETEYALLAEVADAGAEAALIERGAALQAELQQAVRLGATDVYPGCVIGVARFPGDGDSAEQLLEAAQNARTGVLPGGEVALFKPEATTRAIREMHIEAALRKALEQHDEFELHYQPQLDLSDGSIHGAEALLRWDSPSLGRVSPSEFVPVAERVGLIGSIGDWVLKHACAQTAKWERAGHRVRVSVNLSPSQLQRPDLARHVQAQLVAAGADAGSLGVEVTESVVMADVEHAATVLRELKSIGVQVALDDFGTGFSSLSWLCRLPLDVLKIDRSFVHDVTAPSQNVSVTRAIIKMAHGLKLSVLAEGVETDGQLGMLVADGCDFIQGYCFSPAVPAVQFEAMLVEGRQLDGKFASRVRRRRTLLLVDDEENILSALKRLLRRDDYHIVTACNAEQGLLRLTEHEIDVILSDQRMPGMTGVEFLRRAKELYPDTVRMVLSGFTELQSIIDAVNEGAIYKFLTKPWDDELLRGHVAEAFRHKEMADENRRLSQQVETANADLGTLNARLAQLLEQQRRHAEVLAANASNARELLDDLPAAVVGTDLDGVVVFANRRAAEQLPAIDGLLGQRADTLLPSSLLAADAAAGTASADVRLADRNYRVWAHAVSTGEQPRGRLLLFVPIADAEVQRDAEVPFTQPAAA